MQVGIDSYSYHRRYGETRAGEVPIASAPWPLEPGPVLRHARSTRGGRRVPRDLLPARAGDHRREDARGGRPGGPRRRSRGGILGPRAGSTASTAAAPSARNRSSRAGSMRLHAWAMTSCGSRPAARPPAATSRPRCWSSGWSARSGGPWRTRAIAASEPGAREPRGPARRPTSSPDRRRGRTDPNLGVCLDNVNLIRVGDDMAEGTRALAPHTLLVQLKDHLPGDPTVIGGPVCTALGDGVARPRGPDRDPGIGRLRRAGVRRARVPRTGRRRRARDDRSQRHMAARARACLGDSRYLAPVM